MCKYRRRIRDATEKCTDCNTPVPVVIDDRDVWVSCSNPSMQAWGERPSRACNDRLFTDVGRD